MNGYLEAMENTNQHSLTVESTDAKKRLDAFLSANVTALSRSQWKMLIDQQRVLVNGQPCKPNTRLKPGDGVTWSVPDRAPLEAVPEDIPLHILFEDDAVLVLNKPPGMVVHPAVGNPSGTLLHGLLFHDPVFQALERAGIVHRLDKDTSGVMVVAKSDKAMQEMQRQFKARETEKEYVALVWGEPPGSGRVETLLGRHPVHRKKQAVLKDHGREAITNFQCLEQFSECAWLKIGIETGRTHQIRVHMAHLKHPIVGDTVYGRAHRGRLPAEPERQMLHAAKLSFSHPESGKRLSFEAPLFEDMESLLEKLRNG
ncbi:RluA family pseudouridine synthase [Pontiella agarivorans]|uniref:Pseudouridine synthase n=1 Tax=Pontiella agarivorans TaxID=3038953 RepID=A0ABU5MVP2_9BACT|nr:RluA family pseudouridine synthase [Pontiella agarivorans]MDZ8118283.1 RluA family pseudouridine synthase [Pontiella agarivorans]